MFHNHNMQNTTKKKQTHTHKTNNNQQTNYMHCCHIHYLSIDLAKENRAPFIVYLTTRSVMSNSSDLDYASDSNKQPYNTDR